MLINKKCECKYCSNSFYSQVVNTVVCDKCRESLIKCPNCGEDKSSVNTKRCRKCFIPFSKGLTYKQIIKTNPSWINCGFKRGEENIAKRLDIRKRLSEQQVKDFASGKRKLGRVIEGGWHSQEEKKFAEFLNKNNIDYGYETSIIKLNDTSRKIIDFTIGDILIELTGYVFKEWKEEFNRKMKLLRKVVNNQIIIITYDEFIPEIEKNITMGKYDIYVMGLDEVEANFLELLKFCKMIKLGQEYYEREKGNETYTTY